MNDIHIWNRSIISTVKEHLHYRLDKEIMADLLMIWWWPINFKRRPDYEYWRWRNVTLLKYSDVAFRDASRQHDEKSCQACQDYFLSPCIVWHRLRFVPWCWPIGRQSALLQIHMHGEEERCVDLWQQEFPRWTTMTESTKEKCWQK